MNIKEQILSIDANRNNLLKNDHNNPEADLLAKEIHALLITNFNELEFDFILLQLTRLGYAPNLIYDDNGHWAVVTDGFQTVPKGINPQDIESCFFIEKRQWKLTPRRALLKYLKT